MPSAPPIGLNRFRYAALAAQAKGGALDLNKAGQLVVRGNRWHGRATLWLKDHIIPGHKMARNKRVLDAFAKSLNVYASNHQLAHAEQLGADIHLKLDRHSMNQKLLDVIEAAESIDKANTVQRTMPKVMEGANHYLAGTLGKEDAHASREALDIAMGAGYPLETLVSHKQEIGERFLGFVAELAKGENLRPGHEEVFALYRTQPDGELKTPLLRSCMQLASQDVLGSKGIKGTEHGMPRNQLPAPAHRWLEWQYQADKA